MTALDLAVKFDKFSGREWKTASTMLRKQVAEIDGLQRANTLLMKGMESQAELMDGLKQETRTQAAEIERLKRYEHAFAPASSEWQRIFREHGKKVVEIAELRIKLAAAENLIAEIDAEADRLIALASKLESLDESLAKHGYHPVKK